MSTSNLRKAIALGSVAVLLLAEFSLFYDFFLSVSVSVESRQAIRVLPVIGFVLLEFGRRTRSNTPK
jgi:hypothetical protein